MKQILLLIVAVILLAIFIPFGLTFTIVFLLFEKNTWGKIKRYALAIANSLDQLGNVVCGTFLNVVAVEGGIAGNPDDTVSEVIGRAKKNNQLKPFGRILYLFLEMWEENHSVNAID